MVKLNIIQYNVSCFPDEIKKNAQVLRSEEIPTHLIGQVSQQPDIIVINEAYHHSSFKNLADGFAEQGLIHVSPLLGDTYHKRSYGKLRSTNGGMFIASSHELEDVDVQIININRIKNIKIPRGIVYGKITKDGQCFHIFAAHLSDVAPEIQILKSFITSKSIHPEEPIIITGSLGIDKHSYNQLYQDIRSNLRICMPELSPNSIDSTVVTYNSIVKYNNGTKKDEWRDYILYSHDHKAPISSCLTAIRINMNLPVIVSTSCCFPSRNNSYIYDLSDHFPILMESEWD